MTNERYRQYMKKTGFKQWMLADALGVAESTLCRMLREELPEYVIEGFIQVIKCIILETDYDVSFFEKYIREKEERRRIRQKESWNRSQSEYQKWMKRERALDEADQRRIEGGWDLSL